MKAYKSFGRSAAVVAMFALMAAPAWAVNCGTVASPLACSVSSGATTQFTATNFQFLNSVASGAFQYQAGDISIAMNSLGSGAAELVFTKTPNTPNLNTVFFVNPGEATSFTFSYDLAITPVSPGSVSYTNLASGFTTSSTQNAGGTIQAIVAPINCLSSLVAPSNSCPLAGQPTTITPGNILTLTGNNGNASVLNFRNEFQTRFVAVPEPSCLLMLAMGATLAGFRRGKRTLECSSATLKVRR